MMTGIIVLLRGLISKNGLLLAAIAGGLTLFLTYDNSRVQKGRKLEREKIEKATDQITKRARAAGRKSLSGSGGVRNPYYRSD